MHGTKEKKKGLIKNNEGLRKEKREGGNVRTDFNKG